MGIFKVVSEFVRVQDDIRLVERNDRMVYLKGRIDELRSQKAAMNHLEHSA